MRKLFKKLKELTGIKYSDIAAELGVSRQAIDQSMDNYSITHVNANKYILIKNIDESIATHQEQINKLQQLKAEVNLYQVK